MPKINLVERRALKEPTTVEADNGVTFTMPTFFPASVTTSMLKLANARSDPASAAGATREAYAAIFGDDRADEALAAIGLDEFGAILQEVYQIELGEFKLSGAS